MDDKIERWADDIDDNQKPLAENSNPNEIDMECDFYDEDDDSFGGISSTPSKTINATNKNNNVNDNLDETINDRCVNQKTGIIINLNDDDESEFSSNSRHNHLNFDGALESKPIIANEAQDAFRNQTYNDDYSGINEIDMECEFGDEDDFGCSSKTNNSKKEFFNEDDEDIIFESKELVDESIKQQQERINQGVVEKDYWDKIQKKHAKSNVKGAYNVHMHFAGDPELERQDFNHDMSIAKNIDIDAEGDIGDVSASGGEAMGEAKENNKYQKLFEDLLLVTGFDIHKDNDGNIILSDKCNFTQPINCKDSSDVFYNLKPYIEDAYIYPLQYQTKENFNNCSDWCNWYTDEMKQKYPKLQSDIDICDLIANHINEVKF